MTSLVAVIPKSIPAAKKALNVLDKDIASAKTYEAIRRIERFADAIRLLFREVEEVRHQAERVMVRANHRIGKELLAAPKAKGGGDKRSDHRVSKKPGDPPSMKEQVGSKTRGKSLKKLASIPEKIIEKAIETLQEAGKEATVTGVLKLLADDTKSERRAQRERNLGEKIRALPSKHYAVIVADPEWKFEPWSRITGMDRAADNHYPTSCTEVIAARDVPSIAANDCVLFLWATIPMLPHALLVMAAWGFDYKSHYAWGKDKVGTGYWNREKHELLLIGTRGNVPAPQPGTQLESLIMAPRGEHSQKPECFLEMIEGWFPTVPKIELNRRGPVRQGWDAWGNEAEEQLAAE